MNQDQVLGLARHLLTTLGGVLIAKGLLDEASSTQVIGALSTLVGVVWSIMSKKKAA